MYNLIKLFGVFFILFLTISCDQDSQSSSGSNKGSNTGRDYISLMEKGISENGIWGTRCYYSNGKTLEIESPRSVQIVGGWPPKCPPTH